MRSLPQHLLLPTFTNETEAISTQIRVEGATPEILQYPELMRTSRIIHDEPEVWRIWWQLGDIRVAFHKIMPCINACFFHPHPWPSIVRCIKGGYLHRIGIYNGSKEDIEKLQPGDIEAFSNALVPMTTSVSTGDVYRMPDIRHFHQVVVGEVSYSMMIIGQPYFPGATRQFSRKAPDKNIELTNDQIDDILGVVRAYYNVQ